MSFDLFNGIRGLKAWRQTCSYNGRFLIWNSLVLFVLIDFNLFVRLGWFSLQEIDGLKKLFNLRIKPVILLKLNFLGFDFFFDLLFNIRLNYFGLRSVDYFYLERFFTAPESYFNEPALGLKIAPFEGVIGRNEYLISIIRRCEIIDLEYSGARNGEKSAISFYLVDR